MKSPYTAEEIITYIEQNQFDFLDFGCSKGDSLQWARKKLGAKRGLGIDIDPKKLQLARENGHDAIYFNIDELPDKKLVDFVLMSHVLEHLSGYRQCQTFVQRAAGVAKKFIYIVQPWFDSDGELMQNKLKFFWSDWTGHPNRMSSLELYLLFQELHDAGKISAFSVHANHKITSTDDDRIVPLSALYNGHHYTPERDGPKPNPIELTQPAFAHLSGLAVMEGCDLAEYQAKIPFEATFYSSE